MISCEFGRLMLRNLPLPVWRSLKDIRAMLLPLLLRSRSRNRTNALSTMLTISFFRNSNNFLVSGSQDTTVKVWSLENLIFDEDIQKEPQNLSSLFTLKTHDKEVNSVAVSYTDKHFATGSADKTAKVRAILIEQANLILHVF